MVIAMFMLRMQYMQDLECPVTHDTDVLPDMLDWLLHHAVSLEYQDAGESSHIDLESIRDHA